nr:MAG TPA: hypothetical protein [Caudoviricetes sp.]
MCVSRNSFFPRCLRVVLCLRAIKKQPYLVVFFALFSFISSTNPRSARYSARLASTSSVSPFFRNCNSAVLSRKSCITLTFNISILLSVARAQLLYFLDFLHNFKPLC